MSWPVIMHVNSCEQGQTVDEICRNCKKWGYDGIEFRRKRSGIAEEPEQYLDSIARAAEKYGIKKIFFGAPGIQRLSADKSDRERELEELIAFYEMAASRFKPEICNTMAGPLLNPDSSISYFEFTKHGSFIAVEEQWKWAVDGYRILGELAGRLGFVFAFETHMCYLNDTMQSTMRLVNEIDSPAIGVNIDYGNLVYFGGCPSIIEALEMAGDRLFYIHLKNSVGIDGGGRIPSGLAQGDINNRELLKALRQKKYTGPICIEIPRAGDREWYAAEDRTYLKKLMEDINEV